MKCFLKTQNEKKACKAGRRLLTKAFGNMEIRKALRKKSVCVRSKKRNIVFSNLPTEEMNKKVNYIYIFGILFTFHFNINWNICTEPKVDTKLNKNLMHDIFKVCLLLEAFRPCDAINLYFFCF